MLERRWKLPASSQYNFLGGDKRDRTADLLNAIQALSQLSYTPVGDALLLNYKGFCFKKLSQTGGLVKYGARSQLSYTPERACFLLICKGFCFK